MPYRSSSNQESNGNSGSNRSLGHSESCEDRNSQNTSAGGYNDDYIAGESSDREGSGGNCSEKPAHSFGNQRGVSSGVSGGGNSSAHSSGGSNVGFDSIASRYGGVSRVGQIGSQSGSSGGCTGVSSGGQSGDYDSGSRRYSPVSRGGQSGSQDGSSDKNRGVSSGGQSGDYDSGSRRCSPLSRGGQSGSQDGSSDRNRGVSSGGQSGDYDSGARRCSPLSRGGQSGSQDGSSDRNRGVSSGGQSADYDSGSRRYDPVSRGGQSGSQNGSSAGYTGASSGGFDSCSSGQTGVSREVQGGGHGASSGGYTGGSNAGQSGGSSGQYCGSSSRGQSESSGNRSRGHNVSFRDDQSEDHVGSSRGSTGLGGGYSGGQNGGQSGGFSGCSSGNTAGGFSSGFSSRSAGGCSSRGSANHQGFGCVSNTGGFGGIPGGISLGGQRGGFSNGSLGAFSYGGGDGILQAGEKETMQNLNCRLATYMDTVRALEDSNAELEIKIRNWYDTHKRTNVDYTKYYKIIEALKDKIFSATLANNHLTVQSDNAQLAADDFRVKFDSERCLYQGVESDANGLRKVLDDLTLDKSSIESQIENLREELAYCKKKHELEMKDLQGVSSDVTVQMDAAPGVNILKILNDTRAQYEHLAEENRRKAEEEYSQKVSELNSEISHSSEQIESVKSDVMDLRRTMQNMEIELQTQLAMKNSLENALEETEDRYCDQLAQIQDKITGLEDQLGHLRNDLETQSREYKLLLDIRNKLENEIDMYRTLLEEEGGSQQSDSSSRHGGRSDASSASDQTRRRLVTTITEERLNGRIVSTKVDKIPQNI